MKIKEKLEHSLIVILTSHSFLENINNVKRELQSKNGKKSFWRLEKYECNEQRLDIS